MLRLKNTAIKFSLDTFSKYREIFHKKENSYKLHIKYRIDEHYLDPQTNNVLIKIVDIEMSRNVAYIFWPWEIWNNEKIMLHLSPADGKFITQIYLTPVLKNSSKIKLLKRSGVIDENTFYEFFDEESNQSNKIRLETLFESKNLIAQLNAADALQIGFELGYHNASRIRTLQLSNL